MRATTAQARTTGTGKFAGGSAETQTERVLAALVQARGTPLNKAALLRAAYAGQPVPATGDQVIKQLMSKLRSGGAKINYLASVGWTLVAPPSVDASETASPRPWQVVLGAVSAAEGQPVTVDALVAALCRHEECSARLVADALPRLVGDLRRRGHDIRGNDAMGYCMPDGAQTAQSTNGRRIPSHRPCLKCREQFATGGQPLYYCKRCTPNSSDDFPSYSMVGARSWR